MQNKSYTCCMLKSSLFVIFWSSKGYYKKLPLVLPIDREKGLVLPLCRLREGESRFGGRWGFDLPNPSIKEWNWRGFGAPSNLVGLPPHPANGLESTLYPPQPICNIIWLFNPPQLVDMQNLNHTNPWFPFTPYLTKPMLYPWVPPIKKPWIIHMPPHAPHTAYPHRFWRGGDIMSNWEWIQIKNHNVCT